MADAHGSGPCGRKSLRVQLPFRPFSFLRIDGMKNYYYRPSASTLGRKKKIRKKASFSYLKPILFFFVFISLCFASYLGATKAYRAFSASRLANWKPETAVVSGVDGDLLKEIQAIANKKVNTQFTIKSAMALQETLLKKYPQLRKVAVKRGLLSGQLKIEAQRRVPVAKFVLPNKSVRFIDQDSSVYVDPNPAPDLKIPFVELEGVVPEKLGGEFVDLVESSLKLKDQLDFAFLRFNASADSVRMHMPDGCIINFGPAKKMRQNARRAAQIEEMAKEGFPHPHELDFRYFDDGKVFLRQIAH